jgi:CRP-like cAMP-binding protein
MPAEGTAELFEEEPDRRSLSSDQVSQILRESLERIWPQSEAFVRQQLGRDYTSYDFFEKIGRRLEKKQAILANASDSEIDRTVRELLRDAVREERQAVCRREEHFVRQEAARELADPRSLSFDTAVTEEPELAVLLAKLPPDLGTFASRLKDLTYEELSMPRKDLAKVLGYRRNTLDQNLRRLRQRLAKFVRHNGVG